MARSTQIAQRVVSIGAMESPTTIHQSRRGPKMLLSGTGSSMATTRKTKPKAREIGARVPGDGKEKGKATRVDKHQHRLHPLHSSLPLFHHGPLKKQRKHLQRRRPLLHHLQWRAQSTWLLSAKHIQISAKHQRTSRRSWRSQRK